MVRLKRALLILCCCGLLAVLPFVAQAKESKDTPKPRGTLKVVDLWNVAPSVMFNYGEGLVSLDKNNNFVPSLAKEWKWLNEKSIEFKLRKGVSFHNGEKFNAEAVKRNWEAYRMMKIPWFGFLAISDETVFEIIDDFTVRFTFPYSDGLAFVKFNYFVQMAPAYFVTNKFAERKWGYLSEPGQWGTGPFELVEGGVEPGKLSEKVVLKANEKYWDPKFPKVETVIFDNTLLKNREEAMRLTTEKEGGVDIVSFIRPLDTLYVAKSQYAKVVKSRDFTQTHSAINQRKVDSKWKDIRLRKALSYAINREELVKFGAKGNAYNLGGHIPPGARGHNPNLVLYRYDTKKAKALLAEAGYPNGFEMKLITPEAQELEAQVMKRMYERIGLKVTLEVFPWPVWLRKVLTPTDEYAQEQDWDVSVCYNNDSFGHSGAAHLTWPYLDSCQIRWIGYDPVYEEMWKNMAQTIDEEAQNEMMRQMEQYVYENAYAVYIYSPLNLYAVNKEVNFVPQKMLRMRLKDTSVTDNHWSVRSKAKAERASDTQKQ